MWKRMIFLVVNRPVYVSEQSKVFFHTIYRQSRRQFIVRIHTYGTEYWGFEKANFQLKILMSFSVPFLREKLSGFGVVLCWWFLCMKPRAKHLHTNTFREHEGNILCYYHGLPSAPYRFRLRHSGWSIMIIERRTKTHVLCVGSTL